MQRLLNLTESLDGKAIECSFYDNKLLMMISTNKTWFEPGSIYESEDFTDDAKIVLGAMNEIFQIIDDLKLYQDIGM